MQRFTIMTAGVVLALGLAAAPAVAATAHSAPVPVHTGSDLITQLLGKLLGGTAVGSLKGLG
ncbi:hypothetical protein AB0B45_05330 [Nonomuraea sp. NPDC049152]|uniref:hypothetical protein n=1 Tax=Nonomuraea sp. NPDC049152 TaxID=3154350 RepID=UPI0033D6CF3C